MITLINHVIPGPDLHCVLPLVLKGFCNLFLPNIGEDQKKVLSRVRGGGKFSPGYCITFLQRLDEGLRKQLSGQTL